MRGCQAARLSIEKKTAYVPRSEPASYAAGGKRVHVDTVEWIYIPDAATTMNALVAGGKRLLGKPRG
ncbi:MAG: hypothetical protein CM1200mP41_02020 [Gammaproteobacteria bacterium]|nr:MAG: hypothetical protein CM1200mP41_02020 [Gammaproteobacteria bacterium]